MHSWRACVQTGPIQLNPAYMCMIGTEYVSHLAYCIYSFTIYTQNTKNIYKVDKTDKNTYDLLM